jgi:serine/threonine protein kinase
MEPMAGAVGSVESLCNLPGRSRLLKPAQVQAAYRQWRRVEARPSAGETDRFTRWLVGNHYLTGYQARQLAVGLADHFFLNHYKLLDLIGAGRMAGIFKATHNLGHIVAIKVLPAAKSKDEKVLARFQREARMAVRLKHPHIVRSFHLGKAGERYYIVMEHLEGETLEDVLQRRKKLPFVEAVRLLHQAFQALQHIHEQGMIHRDLTPANLMLVPPRPPGTPDDTLRSLVKLLDIGVGRILFDESVAGDGTGQDLTTAGTMLGTPEYMAPEQAKDAHAADIRADIYGLGCVLYHALAGRPPFTSVNRVQLVIKHLTEPPKPLRDFERSIPDGLQAVVNTMLAKAPEQRYATPQHAARALEPFLGGAAAQAAQTSSLMRSYLRWVESQPIEEVNNAPTAADRWYYSRDGLSVGPFPTAQLTQLAAAGKLGPADLLWMEGDNPELAIPAKSAIDFTGLAAAGRGQARRAAPRGIVEESGHDPDTGEIFDPVKFRNWQRAQAAKQRPSPATAPSVSEIFQKGRTQLDAWLDLERNRRPILAGDMDYIRQDRDIQRFMQYHARFGPEMLHKLWQYLQFMIENRRKYFCALG